MNRAQRLFALFGSAGQLAADLNLNRSGVWRWSQPSTQRGGRDGRVPFIHNDAILEAARRRGLDLEEVAACLQPPRCPCCRQPIPAGTVLHRYEVEGAAA